MTNSFKRAAASALALSLGLALAACGSSGPHNASLSSINQPVVERTNYMLDLAAGTSGLTVPEQQRLADWFETLDLGYGDRVAVDDALTSRAVRDDIAGIAARHGILLSEGAPVTQGFVNPGNVRVIVTRSTAHVPDCPNWSGQFGTTLGNKTSPGFGCAVNSNFAAMVADPEHLLEGAKGTGETTVMTSNAAINSFRDRAPTGGGGGALPDVGTGGQ